MLKSLSNGSGSEFPERCCSVARKAVLNGDSSSERLSLCEFGLYDDEEDWYAG